MTTGLIGGRVGNKGGVGVSVKLAGTTLLFINAHLAGKVVIHVPFVRLELNILVAHEGRVHHRLADFAKIKVSLALQLRNPTLIIASG